MEVGADRFAALPEAAGRAEGQRPEPGVPGVPAVPQLRRGGGVRGSGRNQGDRHRRPGHGDHRRRGPEETAGRGGRGGGQASEVSRSGGLVVGGWGRRVGGRN